MSSEVKLSIDMLSVVVLSVVVMSVVVLIVAEPIKLSLLHPLIVVTKATHQIELA
jgi:hypothetical protein